MLTNINMYNAIIGNQQTNVSSTEQVFNAADAVTTTKPDNQTDGNLSLSTRAQKLSAISSEFFSGKAFSSVDTAKLIDRVYEYGLISKSEYQKVSEKTQSADDVKTVADTSTESLQIFIDRFEDRMSNVDGFQESTEKTVVALKEAFKNASAILNDVEHEKKSSDFKAVLAQTKQTLTSLVNGPAFSEMKIDDKVDMSNVIKTLDIIDKINVKRLDNSMVNRYINVANY